MNEKEFILGFQNFLTNSPTAFQASTNIQNTLKENGFTELKESQQWKLEKGGKHFIVRNDSAVIAFIVGQKNITETGFKLIGAHTDSPSFKLKPQTEKRKHNCITIGIEVYGGPILHTWLDKELSIAGRVMIKGDNGWETRFFDYKKPLAIIPNAAIHLNREINKGFEYNKQNHLPAILHITDDEEIKSVIPQLIAEELNVDAEDIGDYDLFLYDVAPATLLGKDQELIACGRLDNLAMCHAIYSALINCDEPESTIVGIFYDNEEIGSRTYQGADSSFLEHILGRINFVTGGNQEDYWVAIAKSFLISADMAHALHPNFAEKHDSDYAPLMNKGPVIKINGNYRYTTTAESGNYFIQICEKAGIPYQKFMVRSDIPCGSTIGPMSSAHMSIKTVDVGNPTWAMHSIRETGGVKDHMYMTKVFEEFYKE